MTYSGYTVSYGLDVTDAMAKMLSDELSKSINEQIILDVISPETKHITDSKLRSEIIKREQKINSIINDDDDKQFNINF